MLYFIRILFSEYLYFTEKSLIFHLWRGIMAHKWVKVGNSGEPHPPMGKGAAVLFGEYRCVLDEKGRLNFPARFRDELGERFIITRWLDNCVVAFPEGEFGRVAQTLAATGLAQGRDLKRFVYANASEAVPDKQGRILVPAPLREHAGLGREVVVIGVESHAEIWDADAWRQMQPRLASDTVAGKMEELGI
jgi:MraZ protein